MTRGETSNGTCERRTVTRERASCESGARGPELRMVPTPPTLVRHLHPSNAEVRVLRDPHKHHLSRNVARFTDLFSRLQIVLGIMLGIVSLGHFVTDDDDVVGTSPRPREFR